MIISILDLRITVIMTDAEDPTADENVDLPFKIDLPIINTNATDWFIQTIQ